MTAVADIIECGSCGAKNRVSADRIASGEMPVCGRCKAPLSIAAAPIVVTESTFAEIVERSPVPVLIDLWAPWCGPCRMLTPALDQIAKSMAGRVRVAKVNVDENPRLAQRFDARSIPLLVIMKNGREVDRMVGVQPAQQIAQRLQAFV